MVDKKNNDGKPKKEGKPIMINLERKLDGVLVDPVLGPD